MTAPDARRPAPATGPRSTACRCCCCSRALPSHAQYKVIGADGKVTYTDRAPSQTDGRVTAMGAHAPLVAPEVELPFELRQPASRYPVTLYVTSGACEPCDSGRALLRQRGIPYTEKQVLSAEDSEALERLSGGRDAPTLTIGSQIVRGMATDSGPPTSTPPAIRASRSCRRPTSTDRRTPIVERREAVARPAPRAARPSPPPPPRAPGHERRHPLLVAAPLVGAPALPMRRAG